MKVILFHEENYGPNDHTALDSDVKNALKNICICNINSFMTLVLISGLIE